MDPDSGNQSDSSDDDTARDMLDELTSEWATEDDDLERLAGLSAYERSMRLRDRTDREESRW